MHLKRWITGLVLLPALIAVIVLGGAPLTLFVVLVAAAALYEYLRIVWARRPDAAADPVSWLLLVTGPAVVIGAHWHAPALVAALLAGNLLAAGVLVTLRYAAGRPPAVEPLAGQVLGSVYVGLPLALIVLMRAGADGAAWVFWLLFLVFIGDIGAFYAGRVAGRRRFFPRVSPKKTVEGALGGLGASVLVGALFKALFLPDLSWGGSLALFVCVGVVAPLGDLFESMLKRIGGIKDSGRILPGHGGMLDRIDALLFAAPVAYFFKVFIL